MKTVISISGAPGTGKTRVGAILARKLGANLLAIGELVKAGKIPYTQDKKRNTKILAITDVQHAVDNITGKRNEKFVIEGLLAHLLKADVAIILRCEPSLLRKRLRARRWTKAKIEENVEAEMLDIITAEAIAVRKAKTYEIDTSHRTPNQTADVILRVIRSTKYANKFKPGKIKWLKSENL